MQCSAKSLSRTAQPDQLTAALGHLIPVTLAARLQAADRFRTRLDAMLAERFGTVQSPDAVQERLLAMDAPALALLAAQAGAVWHAEAIARLVNGGAVRALVAAIGQDLRAVALRGRALAVNSDRALSSDELPQAPEAIAALIPHSGAACLAAWCKVQPIAVGARVRLRCVAATPGAVHRAQGPAIIAWLAQG